MTGGPGDPGRRGVRRIPWTARWAMRAMFDLLRQDLGFARVDPATMPWSRPVLVLRSGDMDRIC